MPATPGYAPYSPQMTREEELDYLKSQAEAIKGQLEHIETRMRDLESQQ
jgi:prefoldin subunit 5